MHHATFQPADLSTFCQLDELGLAAIGQRFEPGRAVLDCRVIEPDPWMESDGAAESLLRVGLGVPDVPAAVARLKANGVDFIESAQLHPEDRGALTRNLLGSVSFELVHQAG